MTDIFTPAETDTPVLKSFEDLVGEGKKYRDTEAVAKAMFEKDAFIQRLQAENAEARQAVTRQLTIDEILTQARQVPPPANPSNPQDPQRPAPETPDFTEIVRKTLTQHEAEEKRKRNLESVTAKLEEKFGTDAQINLTKKARELGVTVDYLKDQAAANPQVFYKLIDLDRPQTPQTTPAPTAKGSVNLPPSESGQRDKAWYAKQKATNPKWYWSSERYVQEYKDMKKAIDDGRSW